MHVAEALDFDAVFASLPKVQFPFDRSLPVRGWLVQGPEQQVVFWHAQRSYESQEHSHPYVEWGVVITGWCEIITPTWQRTFNAGEAFYLEPGLPHASVMSDDYRSMDVFFSPNHVKPEAGGQR